MKKSAPDEAALLNDSLILARYRAQCAERMRRLRERKRAAAAAAAGKPAKQKAARETRLSAGEV